MRTAAVLAVAAASLQLASCGPAGGGEVPHVGRPTSASPPSATQLAGVRIRLDQVAKVDAPTGMAVRAGDPALYFIEQAGRVRRMQAGRLEPDPVLDITRLARSGGEQGLLGIAFSPDGRYLYLDYTDGDGNARLVEYEMRDNRVADNTRRELLLIQHPYSNHNGGQLAFGPDGYLYFGMGDGGSGGDPHDNGQSLGTLLGKILRISPRPANGRPYGIPPDNPFVSRSGARPEIWAYGLRNPWRFSFDPVTHDLWIGDVGQDAWEEIDHQPGSSRGGENYGWSRLEGNHPFKGQAPRDAVPPVLEYPTHGGSNCSVIGGFVYRGEALPSLRGAYVYGDYCAGWIAAVSVQDGRASQPTQLNINVPELSSFGVDQAGELYALSLKGEVFRLAPG